MGFDATNQEGVYDQNKQTNCPECETELKRFQDGGASAEGYGSRTVSTKLVYCPSCSPRSSLDKVKNFLKSL